MEQLLNDDALAALSVEFQAEANRRGIRVLRVDALIFDEPLPRVYLRDATTPSELTALAQALGVQLMYLSERVVEADDEEDDLDEREFDEHVGECQALRLAFPYNGIVHVWERYAPWTDDDSDDNYDNLGVGSSYLSAADRDRLVEFAAGHAALKHLPSTSSDALRRVIDQRLVEIAQEIDIELGEYPRVHLVFSIARRISDNQRSAVDAIEQDLEDWAHRVSQDPLADLPTAGERDLFCWRLLTEHLGFPPRQALSGKVRKLSDSYRRQRGRPALLIEY